jgi:hypothetical protein
MSNLTISRYGKKWAGYTSLQIEFYCIQQGAKWCKEQGRSLFHHYREAFKILWPEDDFHRWNELVLKRYCEQDILVLLGSSDSGKTDSMSKIVLCDYWAFPQKTLWLVSTTEGRGAELRIWGHIKDLFNRALQAGHDLQGHPIDHIKTITTDTIDDDGELARSLKRGIIIIPCKSGGVASGLAPYIGIKAPRLRHCGDEIAVMTDSFLNAYSNWYGKADFKGIMAGNFMETDDPLGIASEPVDSWDSFVDDKKTQEWRSRWYDAWVIALDGRDSPNFDFPSDPPRYSYLISEKKLNMIKRTKGEDSWEWYSQCVGKPSKGMDVWRVITKAFCEKNGAFGDVIWKNSNHTLIYGLDPAYGDGDRCVGRMVEFGEDINGNIILKVYEPEIIPIKMNANAEAEEQIAIYIKSRLDALGIPPENCFYDSFGRGTLGFQFGKLGINPVPIDSGAQPTNRPVQSDLYIEESNGQKRLKMCKEHYRKFITEMWFSVRLVVGCGQVRGMDLDTAKEGQSRKFTKDNGLIEVEPKKDMKKRLGRSPDLFDNLAICVEGCRQRGLKIKMLGEITIEPRNGVMDWFIARQKKSLENRFKGQLQNV